MTTQPKIYTESDYLQAHLTVLDGPSSWMRSFNQQLMELLKRWESRAFAVLLAIFEFRVDRPPPPTGNGCDAVSHDGVFASMLLQRNQ
jgi:hypothetical protein